MNGNMLVPADAPRKAWKSLTALVGTELAAVGTALLDGHLTGPELGSATGLALLAAAAVWRVPNPVKLDSHRRIP